MVRRGIPAVLLTACAAASVRSLLSRLLSGGGLPAHRPVSLYARAALLIRLRACRYVYDIPEHLLHAGQRKEVGRCPYALYDAEMVVHDVALHRLGPGNGTGPHDFFFVPQYRTCHYHQCLAAGRPSRACQREAAAYLGAILDHVESQYPFWGASGGRDHVLIFGHDHGAMEFGYAEWSRVGPAVHLTHTGKHIRGGDFDPDKDIAIPAFRDFSQVTLGPRDRYDPAPGSPHGHRPIFAYFRGAIRDDPAHGHGVRQAIRDLGARHPHHFYVRDRHHEQYWRELQRARYALCPAGYAPWSPRLSDAIIAGAIPVILADDWSPPFAGLLDYGEFALRVPQARAADLRDILLGISPEEEARLRRNLGKVYPHFVYSLAPFRHMDAFASIMEMLARRKRPAARLPPGGEPAQEDGQSESEADQHLFADVPEPHDDGEPPSRPLTFVL